MKSECSRADNRALSRRLYTVLLLCGVFLGLVLAQLDVLGIGTASQAFVLWLFNIGGYSSGLLFWMSAVVMLTIGSTACAAFSATRYFRPHLKQLGEGATYLAVLVHLLMTRALVGELTYAGLNPTLSVSLHLLMMLFGGVIIAGMLYDVRDWDRTSIAGIVQFVQVPCATACALALEHIASTRIASWENPVPKIFFACMLLTTALSWLRLRYLKRTRPLKIHRQCTKIKA